MRRIFDDGTTIIDIFTGGSNPALLFETALRAEISDVVQGLSGRYGAYARTGSNYDFDGGGLAVQVWPTPPWRPFVEQKAPYPTHMTLRRFLDRKDFCETNLVAAGNDVIQKYSDIIGIIGAEEDQIYASRIVHRMHESIERFQHITGG
ncbi:MAG: hypothetical protein HY367_00530 [Candidatus Aenigmarchaeota archaeon]|nr:hypothetical protein [Candidatus Aenigmarchaeota archaeon]